MRIYTRTIFEDMGTSMRFPIMSTDESEEKIVNKLFEIIEHLPTRTGDSVAQFENTIFMSLLSGLTYLGIPKLEEEVPNLDTDRVILAIHRSVTEDRNQYDLKYRVEIEAAK